MTSSNQNSQGRDGETPNRLMEGDQCETTNGIEYDVDDDDDYVFSFSSSSDEEYFDAVDTEEGTPGVRKSGTPNSSHGHRPISSLLVELDEHVKNNVMEVITVTGGGGGGGGDGDGGGEDKTESDNDVSTAATTTTTTTSQASAPNPNDPEYDSCMLKSFVVRNLDTGEVMNLYETDRTINPIYSVLISRVKNYEMEHGIEGGAVGGVKHDAQGHQHHHRSKRGIKYFKKLLKPKTRSAHSDQHIPQPHHSPENPNAIPVVSNHSKKKGGKRNGIIGELEEVQRIQFHTGAIWAMKISVGGQYLATGGQDGYCIVWKVNRIDGSAYRRLSNSFRRKTKSGSSNSSGRNDIVSSSPASETTSVSDQQQRRNMTQFSGTKAIVHPIPFRKYLNEDSGDILDLCWSKSNFLITSSMDKNVRVFHISREECLVTFVHTEIVTCVQFCKDESFFVSGSFDEKVRLFNLRQKQLVAVVDTKYIITAIGLSEIDDRRIVFAGTYDGKCSLYDITNDGFVQRAVIDVRSRRGKNRGRKVTGIVVSPDREHVLITTNDSRIRLYSLRDYSEVAKFKGLENQSSQIKATFNPTGDAIISGSESNSVFLWDNNSHKSSSGRDRRGSITPPSMTDPTSAAKQASSNKQHKRSKHRNSNFEYFSEPFQSVVTNALFLPERRSRRGASNSNPSAKKNEGNSPSSPDNASRAAQQETAPKSFFLLAADFHGKMYIFENKQSLTVDNNPDKSSSSAH